MKNLVVGVLIAAGLAIELPAADLPAPPRALLAMTPHDFEVRERQGRRARDSSRRSRPSPATRSGTACSAWCWSDNFLRAFVDKKSGADDATSSTRRSSMSAALQIFRDRQLRDAGPGRERSRRSISGASRIVSCSADARRLLHTDRERRGAARRAAAQDDRRGYAPGTDRAWHFRFKAQIRRRFRRRDGRRAEASRGAAGVR